MEIKWDLTSRLFVIGEFKDNYNQECSIQKSSAFDPPRIWLGCKDYRMHLTQEQVKALLPVLKTFVREGKLWTNTFPPNTKELEEKYDNEKL